MKNVGFFKKALFATTALAATLLITSCDKDDDDNTNQFRISGTASGSQENPPVSTSAAGTLTGTYDADNNRLDYTIDWTGLSGVVTAAHFHGPALTGANAGPIVDLNITTNGIAGRASGTVILADTTEAHLLNGRIYYNIHTATNPNGEIRGQVTAVADR